MKLSQWVRRQGGPVAVARLLETTPHAVRYWLNGINTPRVATMLRIVALSNGEVTIPEIVRETMRKRASK